MVNQTITTILEELLDSVFSIQATNKENAIENGSLCDTNNSDCKYILELKDKTIILDTVVHLDLTKCNLSSLPDSLSKLPLKSVNLSYNLFSSVPNFILTGLNLLESLNLSHNKITEFEKEPECILHLRILDLSYNKMQYIPIWIVHSKSRNLQELYYSNNILGNTDTGQRIDSLYKNVFLYNLNKMIMKSSYILNENIAFIKSIQTLEILDISSDKTLNYKNSFTNYDDLFNEPAWKVNIKSLDMSCLGMGFLPNGILFLISLRELYLSKNNIYWLPNYIGNLVNLEILDISENYMCFLPNTFADLKKLRILKLQYNKLSSIQTIANLSLDILDLYENELDSCNLNIRNYNYVDLERNYFNPTILDALYIKKRESYRQDYNLVHRILGCCEANFDISSDTSCEGSVHGFSDETRDSSNITPDSTYEEECWEDEKKESHPDITPSDDEWQGYIPKPKPTKKPKEHLNHLLDVLYVDVD